MIAKSKRAMAMGLASVMALSMFAGCSSSSSSTGSTEGSTESSATSQSVDSSESNVAESGTDSTGETSDGGTESTEEVNSGMTSDEVFAEYTSQAKPDETVTINIFSEVSNVPGEVSSWMGDILKEKFNVIVNITNDQSVLSTMLQTGEMGDIVIWGKATSDNYQTAVSSGYLLNWNKDNLLDNYGSYIKENMSDALDYNAEINGGVCYGFQGGISLPGSANSQGLIYTWDTRWDLYVEAGKPEINDLNDYLELMKTFKELEPTDENGNPTYALSMWKSWDGNMVMYVKAFATAYYGYDEWGLGLYDVRTGTFVGALDEDLENNPYYKSLKFINQLYQNDLLDPDSITAEYSNYSQKMTAGGVFSSIFKYAGQDLYNKEAHTSAGKYMNSLIPTEATPLIYATSTTGTGYVWSISSTTKYPELCMDIINWLSTPEGALTMWYGPRGDCWDIDEDGNLYLTDFGLTAQKDQNNTGMESVGYTGTFDKGKLQVNSDIWDRASFIPDDPNSQTFNYETWDLMQTEAVNDAEEDWRETTGFKIATSYLAANENAIISPSTGVSFSNPSKKDALYTFWSQVTTTVVEGSYKCIYATSDEEFDQLWEEMVEEAKAYGYDKCAEYSAEAAETRYLAEQLLEEE